MFMFSMLFQLYFIDHSSRTTTFIDPRLPVEETLPRRNRSETEVRFFNQLIACRSCVLLQRDSFVNNIHPLARCLNRSWKTVSFQEQKISISVKFKLNWSCCVYVILSIFFATWGLPNLNTTGPANFVWACSLTWRVKTNRVRANISDGL